VWLPPSNPRLRRTAGVTDQARPAASDHYGTVSLSIAHGEERSSPGKLHRLW